MRKFIKQIGIGRPRSREGGRHKPVVSGAVQASSVEKSPLKTLADDPIRYKVKKLPLLPEAPSSSDQSYNLSVVAVHGLGGDFFRTWATKDSDKQKFWPSQLLPCELPGARIYSFGYESAPAFSRSVTGIRDSAKALLNDLKDITEHFPDDPIVFICHSLGGIVVKQALILAHEDTYFADVLRATQVIAFMGTPHRGSEIANAMRPLAAFANLGLDVSLASIFTGSMRTDLIDVLSRDSEKLNEINNSFKRRVDNITIISCYERVKPPGSSCLIVKKESALLDIPREIDIPIEADHMEMCRFSSRNDPGYERLTRAIVRAVKQMMPDISHRSFTESESKYIATFSQRTDLSIDEPLHGTCIWSTATQEYRDWLTIHKPAVLWLTGDAGCGKTVLTNFLAHELRDTVTPNSKTEDLVCCFFCASDIESQKDARSLLRTLILQILSAKKDLIHQIKAVYSSMTYECEPSFETLWHIFELAVGIASCTCLYIVIDALDECEEKSRSLFLAKVAYMVRPWSLNGEVWRKRIKFIISGQPLVDRAWKADDRSFSQYHIDMEKRPEGLVRDLQHFIDCKVEELVFKNVCSQAFGETLKKDLYDRSENCFLWLSIVLEYLRQGLNYRDTDLKEELETIPSNLKDSYTKHLPPVPEGQLFRLRCYLQLLVACATPLTISEFDIFTTLCDQLPTGGVSPVEGALVMNSLRRALGPLVKFPDGKVKFVHSTVKEYFLTIQSEPDHPLHKTHGVEMEKAHLLLAKACMQNLLLEANDPDVIDEVKFLPEMPSSPTSVGGSSKDDADQDHDAAYAELFNIQDVSFLRDENHILEKVLSHLGSRYPTYDYITQFWDHHYSQAQSLADTSYNKIWYKYKANHSLTVVPDQSEVCALVLAALFDHSTIIRRLLSNHNIANETTKLQSSLYWASSRGHIKSISVLLEHKSPLLDASGNGSALAVAIQGGFTEACELLLDVGNADPNYSSSRTTPPPLVLAATHNHAEILTKLLQHKAIDVNQTDASGHTALIQACRSDCRQFLKVLLADSRTNINSCDSNNRNALIHACMANQVLAVQELLGDSRLDVHLCDKNGRNAMSYAAEKAKLPIVRSLFCEQVSIEKKDKDGRNAISWASNSSTSTQRDPDSSRKCVLEYLVEKCPDGVGALDRDGWPPLAWAMDPPGYLNVVRILIEKGKADVNQKAQTFSRPLLVWAVAEGLTQIVEYMLGIPELDKNAAGERGVTALLYAAANGLTPIVELLLRDPEVKTDLKDSQGRTAMDLARANHYDEIVSLLSKRGSE